MANPIWSGGPYGPAAKLDGSTQYVSVPDSNSLKLTSRLTITAWIKPTSFNTNSQILMKNNANSTFYGLVLATSSGNPRSQISGNTDLQSTTAITLNVWSFVALTFDNALATNQIKIYVNGVLVSSGTGTTATTANSAILTIGRDNVNAGRGLPGFINNVRLFNRGLLAVEIMSLYTSPFLGLTTLRRPGTGSGRRDPFLVNW